MATAAAAKRIERQPTIERNEPAGRLFSDCFLGDSMHGYSMGMQGWNTGWIWMWICGVALVVVLALILRVRK